MEEIGKVMARLRSGGGRTIGTGRRSATGAALRGALALVGLAGLAGGAWPSLAAASVDPSAPRGMVDSGICPDLPDATATRAALTEMFLEPGPIDIPAFTALADRPDHVAYRKAQEARDAQDWGGLCVYRAANAGLLADDRRPRVVLFGDSITENWIAGDPGLFAPDGGMRPGVANDGVHPNRTGYALMRKRLEAAIAAIR